jgi:hypothetical protein
MEAMSEVPSNRAFDTGAYSPLIGSDDSPPEQSPDIVVLYASPEEEEPAPEDSEEGTQNLGSVPVYKFSPSLTLHPSHPIARLLVLSPPQQNVQRSSAPAPDRSGEGSWTRSVTPLRGHGASLLGSRVKK